MDRVRFTRPGETDCCLGGEELFMAEAEKKNESEAAKEKRERLEPWRPAFDKILFAIRKVQKLEDSR